MSTMSWKPSTRCKKTRVSCPDFALGHVVSQSHRRGHALGLLA
jgi:hypothetical protein